MGDLDLSNLRKLRKERNLLQKDLAKYLGITIASYSLYENNKRTPPYGILKKLCKFYNIDMDLLIGLREPDQYHIVYENPFEDKEQSPTQDEYEQLLLEDATKKAPKFTDKAEVSQKKSKLFTRSKKGKVIEDGKPPKFTAPSTTYAPQEAYELLHSLIDKEGIDDREREEVSQQLKKILGSFKGLNEIGRKKAVERIEELYMIPKYIFDNFPDKID